MEATQNLIINPLDIRFKVIADNSLKLYKEISQAVLDELAKHKEENPSYDENNQELNTMQYEIVISWDKGLETLPELQKLKYDQDKNEIAIAIPINRELFEFNKENLIDFLDFYHKVYTTEVNLKEELAKFEDDKICYFYIFSILVFEEEYISVIFENFLERPNQAMLIYLLLISLNYNYQEGCIFFWDILLMFILKIREFKDFEKKPFQYKQIANDEKGIIRIYDVNTICLHKPLEDKLFFQTDILKQIDFYKNKFLKGNFYT